MEARGRSRPLSAAVALAVLAAMVTTNNAPPRTAALDRLEIPRANDAGAAAATSAICPQRPGGRTVAHHAAQRAASRAAQQRAPRGSAYCTGTGAYEPTLGVDRKGHLYYVGIEPKRFGDAFIAQAPVLRSTNGGRTWREVSPRLGPERRHLTTLDPFLYVDELTDRIFTMDHLGGCPVVSFSADAGASWTTSASCGLTDHQNVFAGPPVTSPTVGYPNIVYQCAIDGGALNDTSTVTSCMKSLDGGVTWVRTGTPAYTDDAREASGQTGVRGHCGGATGHGVTDRAGVIYLPRGWCGQPYLAISRDEGATWTRVRVSNLGMPRSGSVQEHEASVAVDRAGTIYYFWMDAVRMPYLTLSRDGGTRWSKPVMIGPPGLVEAWGPTLAVGANGKIAVAYVGTTGLSRWNGYITMSANALASRPLFYSGTVHDPADHLIHGGCAVIRCGVQFDFIDVVITPDGAPVASFVDGCPPGGRWGCGATAQAGAFGIVGRLDGGPRLR